MLKQTNSKKSPDSIVEKLLEELGLKHTLYDDLSTEEIFALYESKEGYPPVDSGEKHSQIRGSWVWSQGLEVWISITAWLEYCI